MKNSRILRKAALGDAPNVKQEYACEWLSNGFGVPSPALVAVYRLFPPKRSVGGTAFGGLTESEARLALLFVAAAEEAEGR